MPEPINPPAIVRSEVDIETLLRDARMFGRQTVEAAIKCGELLAKAKEQCPHGEWLSRLAKHGFKPRTAQLLIASSKDPSKCANIAHLTGTDAGEEAAKPTVGPTTYAQPLLYCRPCRTGKPKAGCKACKALRQAQGRLFQAENPPLPEPEPAPTGDAADEVDDKWLKDAEGNVLSEKARPAFEQIPKLKEFKDQCHSLREQLAVVASMDAGKAITDGTVELLRKRLNQVASQVWNARPMYRCYVCSTGIAGCKKCNGSGWLNKGQWGDR